MNLCDIKFRILDKRTSEVDGPSAGLMFSVVLYGLENGKHIPSNIYATGEIDEKGDVLPVGGLYEKALNLCRNHPSSRILTSKIPWLEYHIIAARMKPTCPSATLVSIDNVSNAIEYVYYGKNVERYINLESESERKKFNRIGKIHTYPDDTFMYTSFKPVTNEMILQQIGLVNELELGDDPYVKSVIQKEKVAVGNNYLYTAANYAFNNYADLYTYKMLKEYDFSSSDKSIQMLRNEIESILTCASHVNMPNITSANIEYVIPAKIRFGRARAAAILINNTLSEMEKNTISDDVIQAYKILSTAKAWCLIGNSLIKHAPTGGEYINNTIWKGMADKEMKTVKEYGCRGDIIECKNAEDLLSNGEYGASAVELAFVMGDVKYNSSGNMSENTENKNTNNTTNITGVGHTDKDPAHYIPRTLWGRLYYSQAVAYDSMFPNESHRYLYVSSRNVDRVYVQIYQTANVTLSNASGLSNADATNGGSDIWDTLSRDTGTNNTESEEQNVNGGKGVSFGQHTKFAFNTENTCYVMVGLIFGIIIGTGITTLLNRN